VYFWTEERGFHERLRLALDDARASDVGGETGSFEGSESVVGGLVDGLVACYC
jgi:hypothetical protein